MSVQIINGYTDKPLACQKLKEYFLRNSEISGFLYVGYPFICSVVSIKLSYIDCLLISPEKGLVAFNLVEEETVPPDYVAKQEDVCQVIEWYLKSFGKLVKKHKLMIDINIVTFAPNSEIGTLEPVCNEQTLGMSLAGISLSRPELYDDLDIAVRTVGKPLQMIERTPSKPGSKGAHCVELEKRSSLILDSNQIRAALETEEGVQRIRGLSGSGKSTVLALKVAYIHACHPEWKIGMTYGSFSSRDHYRNAISLFYRKQTGLTPNWDNITICMVWGRENGKDETAGMYQIFTAANSIRYYGRKGAQSNLGISDPFGEACERALYDADYKSKEVFDILIIDEAQEFPQSFTRMCYAMLRAPKRLVYAYDELQSSRPPLPKPEEIFGDGDNGMLEVYADIVLDGCYERPPAILSTAHALALGIYREHPKGKNNMVQMFESIHMWNALGYKVLDGCLDYGKHVVMGRHPIERLNDKQIDDQIVFKSFESLEEQDAWVVQEIKRNLTEDGTQARDIMVVVPAMQLAYTGSAEMRGMLSDEKIPFHVVGEDESDDKFWNGESVAICGILKARSNEAPMVYVVEAHNAFYTRYDAAMNRNFLYAAITRSRAWVRVAGFGQEMDSLVEEFERIKSKGFKFDFVYPTRKELSKLRLVYREAGQELGAERLEPEKVIGEAVELIRQGKIELDEEQKGVLRDWLDREAKL